MEPQRSLNGASGEHLWSLGGAPLDSEEPQWSPNGASVERVCRGFNGSPEDELQRIPKDAAVEAPRSLRGTSERPQRGLSGGPERPQLSPRGAPMEA